MKLHRNAKSTPASRLLMVQRVLAGAVGYQVVADGFAVSGRTVAKWVRRFKDAGVAGLEDRPSRPGVSPTQTSAGPGDPRVLTWAVASFAMARLLAMWWPAARAASTDPASVLKES